VKLVEERGSTFAVQAPQFPSYRFSLDRGVTSDEAGEGAILVAVQAALRDSHVELVLQPERFLFKSLDLPKRAMDFLGSIIRAQIDRLSPWNKDEAIFGWSKPNEVAPDKIRITLAVTSRAAMSAITNRLLILGVRSISLCVTPPGDNDPISMIGDQEQTGRDIGGMRRRLLALITVVSITTLGTVFYGAIEVPRLEAMRSDLQRQIAAQRAATFGAAAGSEHDALEMRKSLFVPSVVTLENLSRLLPDHTHVAELQIEDQKVRLIGVTGDAPSLISLLEQSGQFTRATFFAPTTRSTSDAGERFHIEAQIRGVEVRR